MEAKDQFDFILEGGTVIDGSGSPGRRADVGIRGDRIEAVGDLKGKASRKRINVGSLVVTPGFIDLHSHDDLILALPAQKREKLIALRILQGITTEIVGNCALGFAPLSKSARNQALAFQDFLVPEGVLPMWESLGEYLRYLEENRLPLNVGALVPHGALKLSAENSDLREEAGKPGKARDLLSASLEEGAFGLSFGLIYPPGLFTTTAEIVELAREVARCEGTVAFHQRSASSEVVLRAVDEIVEVGKKSGAKVHHSHDHLQGRRAWAFIEPVLQKQDEARSSGVRYTADVIPYSAVTTTMLALYPPWALEGGVEDFLEKAKSKKWRLKMRDHMERAVPSWPPWEGRGPATNLIRDCGWESVVVWHVGREENRRFEGLSAVQIAELTGKDPFDAVTDLLIEENARVTMLFWGISGDPAQEEALKGFLRDPYHAVVSDAWDTGRGKPHPGISGAFPRFLGRYVREQRLLSMEEAIRKVTSFPAVVLGLKNRGLLKEGNFADIVVFDPEGVSDRSDFQDPRRPPEGIHYVFINGVLVGCHGKILSGEAGRVLRPSRP